MKKFLSILFVLTIWGLGIQAQQPTVDYYLPGNITYDSSIPTPEDVLGFMPGEWHVRHDQLVNYMYAVAEASGRVTITSHYRSHENREGVILTITSASNQANIDRLKVDHVKLTDPSVSDQLNIEEMPIVVNMSYSIHGNEPSGSNAAPLVVYYLAAAQGNEIEELLDNTIILVDPSLNPDGLGRFAHWANIHKNTKTLTTDPEDREYNEVWPGGRTNHYWFDLNRDWLLVQHPESQGRIEKFHEWKPNILTDFHEMGSNATYFFQPGVPQRTHPITPQRNQALTAAIAEYHADALDEIQSLYYSGEGFDDFYYGKGSTYPDVNGSVGILFEQASARGHAQETIHGTLTFPFAIRNQVTASMSTFEAAKNLRTDLLEHMRQFYKEAAEEAASASIKGYVFGEKADKARTYHFAEMLKRHQIDVYELAQNVRDFESGSAFIVPANQPQHKLIKATFERRSTFTDSLFYDVSSWTMPYAFNLPFAELNSREFDDNLMGDAFSIGDWDAGQLVGGRSNYAYLFEWDEYYAPRAVNRLLASGVRVKVASKPLTAVLSNGVKEFDYGTILVSLGIQDDKEKVHDLIETIVEEDGITVYSASTGLTPSGIDFGSNDFEKLEKPEIAIIGGEGTSSYEVGEAWHLLDHRYEIPPTILDKREFGSADLDRYNVIVMANGRYNDFSEREVEKLKRWVREGGVLVAYKYAIQWAKQHELADIEFVNGNNDEDNADNEQRPYARASNDFGSQVIGGAIFNTKLDLTHPLAYGYNDDDLTVFRNSTLFMQKGENPYSSPVVYTDQPLASGYISDENTEKLSNSAAVVVSSFGSGRVIAMTDNPNFRAFWYGTNKLFMNAVFFGHTISGSTAN